MIYLCGENRRKKKENEGCFVFGSDSMFFCVLIYGGFMLICSDDCVIFFVVLMVVYVMVYVVLMMVYVVLMVVYVAVVLLMMKKINMLRKRCVVVCCYFLFSQNFSFLFCGKTSFIYRCLDPWRSS